MKDNAVYKAVESRKVPESRRILKDEIIRLTGLKAVEKCPSLLRRIEMHDLEKNQIFVFLTNHLTLGSSTIYAIYKDRWQVELFFKALKQNLKIKTFVGTIGQRGEDPDLDSTDFHAAATLPATSPCFGWSLANLVALLRMNLFTHRDLWVWLEKPFDILPKSDVHEKLQVDFA